MNRSERALSRLDSFVQSVIPLKAGVWASTPVFRTLGYISETFRYVGDAEFVYSGTRTTERELGQNEALASMLPVLFGVLLLYTGTVFPEMSISTILQSAGIVFMIATIRVLGEVRIHDASVTPGTAGGEYE